MKSLLLAASLGLGALGLVGLTPSQADASWLSEALHARFDPYYYGGYDVPPAYGYYAPPAYYAPRYYGPGVSFYRWSGPRYHGHHWHGQHEVWHGGHGHHHHR